MDIFNVFAMLGGVGIFLYGMKLLGDALQSQNGSKMEGFLSKMTDKFYMSVLFGMAVTSVIQSSSGTTVMVIGLVNAGIMELRQAVGVIMGANIGTTITSWVLSLSGIKSDAFILRLINPSGFSPLLIVAGIILIMFVKQEKKRLLGETLFGFGLLMFGMNVMSDAIAPLVELQGFKEMFLMFENPVLGVLCGTMLTAVIQSSSASIGILQALAITGVVSWKAAIPIILGQNIGTCITAILASVGANKNAKRASVIHLSFNLIGTLTFMIVFYSLNAFLHFAFLDKIIPVVGIAIFHSAFNIGVTLLLMPFASQLVKLSCLVVRDDKPQEVPAELRPLKLLEHRFLDNPSFALRQAGEVMNAMSQMTRDSVFQATSLFEKYDDKTAQKVIKLECAGDKYEDELQTFLLKISGKELFDADARQLNIMLHAVSDFERISDYASSLVTALQDPTLRTHSISAAGQKDLGVLMSAVREIVDKTHELYITHNTALTMEIEGLEETIDDLTTAVRDRHIDRLQKDQCSPTLGFVFSNILNALERISDHCSKVAFYIQEITGGAYDRHVYKTEFKRKDQDFVRVYEEYRRKYKLEELIHV